MILEHTFEEETHLYKVPGQFVLSTSDIISLNGLGLNPAIPQRNVVPAGFRGKQLHKAVQFFEEDGDIPEMSDEVLPYFRGYMKFRLDYDFEPIGAMEKQIVYIHEGTDQPIGCTIDLRGYVKGKPYIIDAKTTAKMYGKALRMKCLAWRLQLASYSEATEMDEDWWYSVVQEDSGKCAGVASKAIVQVNKEGGYEFHDFSAVDDTHLWDGAVRMAMAKLAAGFQLERR